MKLHSEIIKKYITPSEMKDGEIGIIREWGGDTDCVGLIVQRYGKMVIPLGEPSGKSYTTGANIDKPAYQIEILPPSTLLEI